jgi:hypothetical protein
MTPSFKKAASEYLKTLEPRSRKAMLKEAAERLELSAEPFADSFELGLQFDGRAYEVAPTFDALPASPDSERLGFALGALRCEDPLVRGAAFNHGPLSKLVREQKETCEEVAFRLVALTPDHILYRTPIHVGVLRVLGWVDRLARDQASTERTSFVLNQYGHTDYDVFCAAIVDRARTDEWAARIRDEFELTNFPDHLVEAAASVRAGLSQFYPG